MIEKFKTILWHLEHRQNMYTGEGHIPLINFIDGYELAMRDYLQIDILEEFREWLKEQQQYQFSMHWGYYILRVIADNDEQVATKKLFELLKEFLNSRK